MDCERIVKEYTDEPIEAVEPISGGHINKSFLVTAGERFVLQRLNPALYADCPDALENNYGQYRQACGSPEGDIGKWHCPEWMRNRDGGYFYRDPDGNIWRMYRFLPSDRDPKAPGPDPSNYDPYAVGIGLGKLHRIMKRCEGIIGIAQNTRLYDLSYHYNRYRMQEDSPMPRVEEFDRQIEDGIDAMLHIIVPGGSVIHGDAKVGNMIFENGEVVGFVDLDTIMPGSVFDDLADCIRSCCFDEDGQFDHERAAGLISGYSKGADTTFTDDAVKLLGQVIARNRFMLGMRYYTDYLSGEGYFADLDPNRKLERACELLR